MRRGKYLVHTFLYYQCLFLMWRSRSQGRRVATEVALTTLITIISRRQQPHKTLSLMVAQQYSVIENSRDKTGGLVGSHKLCVRFWNSRYNISSTLLSTSATVVFQLMWYFSVRYRINVVPRYYECSLSRNLVSNLLACLFIR